MKLTSALAIVAVVTLTWSGVGPHAVARSLLLELLTSIVRGSRETKAYGIADEPTEPKLFAEGVISPPGDESGGSMSPDGRDFYFRKITPYTLDPSLTLMCVSHSAAGNGRNPRGFLSQGSMSILRRCFLRTANTFSFRHNVPCLGRNLPRTLYFTSGSQKKRRMAGPTRDLCLPPSTRKQVH